ncbi:DUF2560 family protein [Sodalis ligni]|uniref:DUF2560 family protein n=1 Tax=Sodalis ligni TaxID=2697027 RepID=UPI00244356DC|nr:DUF2560 family protein [Sodalis ligni]
MELSQAQLIRMNLLSTLNCDTAAATLAIEFVQDDPLNYQMFMQQYGRVTTESEVVARTLKAFKESQEALALFSIETNTSTATS